MESLLVRPQAVPYSLSGNGSIIHPDVKAINLLPMFPHSLNARPLIIDHESIIKIRSEVQ